MTEDEYVLDTPVVREFVAGVRATIAAAASPPEACHAIRPRFAELLADADWLPARYQEGDPGSGMGGGESEPTGGAGDQESGHADTVAAESAIWQTLPCGKSCHIWAGESLSA